MLVGREFPMCCVCPIENLPSIPLSPGRLALFQVSGIRLTWPCWGRDRLDLPRVVYNQVRLVRYNDDRKRPQAGSPYFNSALV